MFNFVFSPKSKYRHYCSCVLLIVWSLPCSTVLASTMGVTPGLSFKPSLRVIQLLTIWNSSWVGSEVIQLGLKHCWAVLHTGLSAVCLAQLVPCSPALLVLAWRIRIQDSLLSVLKGARCDPPEEMMTSVCNQTASQAFVACRSIAVETACKPQIFINNTKRNFNVL